MQRNLFSFKKHQRIFYLLTLCLFMVLTNRKALAQSCGNPVNAPVTLNGISVTGAGTGSVSTYPNPITSCINANTPANAIYIGQNGAFTYTYTFSQAVNDVVIVINATGNTFDEFFTITTNGPGTPNVTSGNMCYTVITGNFIASGLGSPAGVNGGGGGIFTINNPGGNYTTVTITGPGGQNGSLMALCSLSIVPPCPLNWNTVNVVDLSCNGLPNGSISLTTVNGVAPVNYTLQPGNITNQSGNFSNLAAGVYTITAADANCNITTTVTVNQPLAVSPLIVSSTDPTCLPGCDGTVTVNVNAGVAPYTYTISAGAAINASGIASGLCSGSIYTITVTDASSCSGSVTAQLVAPNSPAVNLVSKTNVSCSGNCNGTINVSGNGGVAPYTFSINPVANQPVIGSFDNLCGGNYTVTVTDANGCSQNSVITIAGPPSPIVFTAVNIHKVYCHGDATGSIAVVADGGSGSITFSTSPAATQFPLGFFKDLSQGNYTITALDANGCSATTLAQVTENPPLQFNSISVENPICSYDSTGVIHYTASGGEAPIVYSLNDGLPHLLSSFDGLSAGVYKLKLIDNFGCSKDTFLTLTSASPVSAVIQTRDALCVDSASGRVDITGTGGYGGYRYFVTPGLHINKSGEFLNMSPDTYTLRVVDTLGCEYQTSFLINQPADPLHLSIIKQDLACYGRGNEGYAVADVLGGHPPYVYEWSTSPVQTTAKAEKLYFGSYQLNVTDAAGCRLADTVYIHEGPCCDVAFIPNAFTPNGDNLNDEFVILTTAGVVMKQLDIYDRWGQKVYSASDWRRGWDGTIDGKEAAVATYFYVYRYSCTLDGKDYLKKGDVLLIR